MAIGPRTPSMPITGVMPRAMSRRLEPGAMVGGAVLQALARHGLAAVPPSPVVAWRGMALPMAAVGFGGEVLAAPVARTTVVSAPITGEGCAGGGQNEQRGKGTCQNDLFFHDFASSMRMVAIAAGARSGPEPLACSPGRWFPAV